MFSTLLTPEFMTLLGIMGAGFAGFAKAVQWYIVRVDTKHQAALLLENEQRTAAHEHEVALRDKIQSSFEERIRFLEVELGVQKELVRALNQERQVFLRRIYQLEAYIQYSKLDVPHMEGWPP
jgi:hypothetical protein